MLYLSLSIIFISVAVWSYLSLKKQSRYYYPTLVLSSILAVTSLSLTSIHIVDKDKVGHLTRIYFGDPLKAGQIIALEGQNGPQARVLGPGFHFSPLLTVIYDIEELPIVSIPNDQYGLITAKDGQQLQPGQFLSDPWPADQHSAFLNAEYFLTQGGQKGPQLMVLKPGQYRINHYLYEITNQEPLDVRAGEVAVVKSNINQSEDCQTIASSEHTPLVKQGCAGVWQEVLGPGKYYLNHLAYQATIIPTLSQQVSYKGGYTKRQIELSVANDGNVVQQVSSSVIEQPIDATDQAITVMFQGWPIATEIRLTINVSPNNAPRLVANIGDLEQVKQTVITPFLRSEVQNIVSEKNIPVADIISRRAELEAAIHNKLEPELAHIGVMLQSVRLGELAIPAEILAANQRKQLAGMLSSTFEKEHLAQQKRIELEKTKASANEQATLAKAEVEQQVANKQIDTMKLRGRAEKLRLREVAQGQQAMVSVFGKDRVLKLTMLKEVLDAAKNNPEMVKVPTVLVQGESNGLNGPAAVLGASNILEFLEQDKETTAPKFAKQFK